MQVSLLPDFPPPTANCKTAGSARGPDSGQGQSTSHAHCHFFWDSWCKWLAPSLGELSSLIIHCHLDVSKISILLFLLFFFFFSCELCHPLIYQICCHFLNTSLFISNMVKHALLSLYMDQITCVRSQIYLGVCCHLQLKPNINHSLHEWSLLPSTFKDFQISDEWQGVL